MNDLIADLLLANKFNPESLKAAVFSKYTGAENKGTAISRSKRKLKNFCDYITARYVVIDEKIYARKASKGDESPKMWCPPSLMTFFIIRYHRRQDIDESERKARHRGVAATHDAIGEKMSGITRQLIQDVTYDCLKCNVTKGVPIIYVPDDNPKAEVPFENLLIDIIDLKDRSCRCPKDNKKKSQILHIMDQYTEYTWLYILDDTHHDAIAMIFEVLLYHFPLSTKHVYVDDGKEFRSSKFLKILETNGIKTIMKHDRFMKRPNNIVIEELDKYINENFKSDLASEENEKNVGEISNTSTKKHDTNVTDEHEDIKKDIPWCCSLKLIAGRVNNIVRDSHKMAPAHALYRLQKDEPRPPNQGDVSIEKAVAVTKHNEDFDIEQKIGSTNNVDERQPQPQPQMVHLPWIESNSAVFSSSMDESARNENTETLSYGTDRMHSLTTQFPFNLNPEEHDSRIPNHKIVPPPTSFPSAVGSSKQNSEQHSTKRFLVEKSYENGIRKLPKQRPDSSLASMLFNGSGSSAFLPADY